MTVSDDATGPLRTVRGRLPAEIRLLRGALGLAGGAVLLFAIANALLSANWRLGFANNRLFTPVLLAIAPMVLGLASPLWYWIGRPLWHHLDRPGAAALAPLSGARFLPGLASTAVGLAMLLAVRATSPRPVQVLVPLGIGLAVLGPLWYWIARPLVGEDLAAWLPEAATGEAPRAQALRMGLGVAVLLALAVGVTVAVALPIVAPGDPVTAGGLTVAVTDVAQTDAVVEREDGDEYGTGPETLLLVRVAVENPGDRPRSVPSALDVSVFASACSAQTFGEPARNCNQPYVSGPFEVDGERFANYDDQQAAMDGTLAPGDRVAGWLVYRIESPPADEGPVVVIVDDVGRWRTTSPVGEPASARVK